MRVIEGDLVMRHGNTGDKPNIEVIVMDSAYNYQTVASFKSETPRAIGRGTIGREIAMEMAGQECRKLNEWENENGLVNQRRESTDA